MCKTFAFSKEANTSFIDIAVQKKAFVPSPVKYHSTSNWCQKTGTCRSPGTFLTEERTTQAEKIQKEELKNPTPGFGDYKTQESWNYLQKKTPGTYVPNSPLYSFCDNRLSLALEVPGAGKYEAIDLEKVKDRSIITKFQGIKKENSSQSNVQRVSFPAPNAY